MGLKLEQIQARRLPASLRSLMSVDINVNWARAAIVLSKEAAPPNHRATESRQPASRCATVARLQGKQRSCSLWLSICLELKLEQEQEQTFMHNF